jgi:hypothetical protein
MVGHTLAVGVERPAAGTCGTQLADFVIDPLAPLPPDFEVYCWLFPFRRQIAIRDAMLIRGGRDNVPPPYFPEAPTSHGAVFYGDSGMGAMPREKRPK